MSSSLFFKISEQPAIAGVTDCQHFGFWVEDVVTATSQCKLSSQGQGQQPQQEET